MNEAYEALAREKGKGESFTDVILKLVGRTTSLSDCIGTWDVDDEEWARIEKDLVCTWRSFEGRLL